ncbi:MAG: transglycosylase domain-containing protein [Acidimicrobiales bacterium]
MVRRVLKWCTVAVVALVGAPMVAGATVIGSLIFLPLPATLPSPKPTIASRGSTVYDASGKPIARIPEFDQSIPVSPADIPQVLKNALVASEDKNFFHEGGVDPRATVRAIIRDIQGKGYLQGGSTITQQYVSLAYTGKKRTLFRKLKEAILAGQLARKVPKEQVLFDYLDSVYLGDGAYGVGAAAETYFRKPVSQLTIGEAALLVGVIPAPSRYEPRTGQVLAEQRRETVLLKMYQQHYITEKEYQYWKVAQVYEATAPPLPAGAPETLVYPQQTVVTKYPYFVDYVRRYLEAQPGIGPDMLYRGGLQIQTTLDTKLQDEAEASVAKTLQGTPPNLEMSLVSIEPQTGHVRVLVGGRDFVKDAVNLALGGCDAEPTKRDIPVKATCTETAVPEGGGSGRQPGSAFKPFVLATALSDGVLPSETIYGPSSITLPKGCTGTGCQTIHNAGDSESGTFNLAQATWFSVNTVYAQLILDSRVTVQRTAETAKKLGVTNAWYAPSVHGVSYALGALDVSPLDMASAYGVFDNHGIRVAPTPVLLIKDTAGHVIVDNTNPQGTRVLNAAVADNVTNILTGVITTPAATGYGSADIGRPAAGKTGTTTNFVDAWFVGYVPTLSTSVWMGYKNSEDPKKGASMTNLRSGRGTIPQVFGGTLPAETWAEYMKQAVADVPVTNFNDPPPLRPLADALDAGLRGGINPGDGRGPVVVGPGGPYQQTPTAPTVVAPTTLPPETTTEPPRETTTTSPRLVPPGGL